MAKLTYVCALARLALGPPSVGHPVELMVMFRVGKRNWS
jgi:hypothetical protein